MDVDAHEAQAAENGVPPTMTNGNMAHTQTEMQE